MANTNDYRNMNPQDRMDRLERARFNSINTYNSDIIDVRYKGDRFKLSAQKLKVAVVTTFLATAIAATGVGIGLTKVVDKVKDEQSISFALEEYDSILDENTHRTKHKDGYWHNYTCIATDILHAEDRDLAIYAVYNDLAKYSASNDIDYNRTKNMTDIFSEIDRLIIINPTIYPGIPVYGGYQNYLKEMGCVDKDGNISTKMYENKMDKYAAAVANMNKAESSISKGK